MTQRIFVSVLVLSLLGSCASVDGVSGNKVHGETAAVQSSKSDDFRSKQIARMFENIPQSVRDETDQSKKYSYSQHLAMVGRDDLLTSFADTPGRARECSAHLSVEGESIEEVVRRADETRVVIVNEAHDQPQHRFFIRQVVERLWTLNYRVYAAETFAPNIASTQSVPYANLTDGYYSNEPVFGALLREAKRVGYRFAHYERTFSEADAVLTQQQRADKREEEQALNLVEIVNGLGAGERLLVHVGYSHASEVPIRGFDGGDLDWMALRFKNKTGIDPLTIDQTKCISSDNTLQLFKDAGRVRAGQFDLQIAHPRTEFEQGRPKWRRQDGAVWVAVPTTLRSTTSRVIVEARRAGDPLNAVPSDRIMLWPGEDLPLVLLPGAYDITSNIEEGGSERRINNYIVK